MKNERVLPNGISYIFYRSAYTITMIMYITMYTDAGIPYLQKIGEKTRSIYKLRLAMDEQEGRLTY